MKAAKKKPERPIRTRGLTHVALAVRDPQRSLEFYAALVGAKKVYEDPGSIQAQTPGTHDVLVFERDARRSGRHGGIAHFGFRLVTPVPVADLVARVAAAGGTVQESGEFVPGAPYVFCSDPDGYVVELWYEAPTPYDPKPAPRRRKVTAGR